VPQLDLDLEVAVQRACLDAAEAGLLQSAHDCADGGIAVALVECCFSSLRHEALGASVDLKTALEFDSTLFSESPSRIIISFNAKDANDIEAIARRSNAPLAIIGRVGGDAIRITVNGNEAIESDVKKLEDAWRNALPRKLQAEAMAAGRE
jgi:phosphoribosylformylglycinamidine synthase